MPNQQQPADISRGDETTLCTSRVRDPSGQGTHHFLSRVNQEMRTPLNAVIGFAQLLLQDSERPLDSFQRNRAEHIERAGAQLLELINDILDMARSESAHMNIPIEAVNIEALLNECVSIVAPWAATSGVTLIREAPSSGGCVAQANATRLKQAFLNLLSNAVKYNRSGGEVRVLCDGNADTSIARLIISDTGRGMNARQRQHLFHPPDHPGVERRQPERTGAGFTIAHKLVEAMNGAIAVQSEVGRGTTVTINLPLAAQPLAVDKSSHSAPIAAPEEARRTVLYVEDNELNRKLIQAVFETLPHLTLVLANDGESAIEIARQSRPELAIIDLNLPDMHGAAVLNALRASEATQDCTCVALSADVTPRSERDAQHAGFMEFWPKPIDVIKFRNRLQAVLISA